MQQTKSIMGVCAAKQSRGRPQSPLVASAEAKSLQQKRPAPRENDFSRCWSVAPIWRDNVEWVERAVWGRVCGRAKLLRRDAALPATKAAGLSAFGITGRPWNGWGVAPSPTKGAASGLRKGQLPLDPFARLSWFRCHTPSACSFLGLRLSRYLSAFSQLSQISGW